MAEYIDIDQPLIFKDIRNRDVTGTIRTILKANHTELALADVAPVRHGRWIFKVDSSWRGGGKYECSACKYGYAIGAYHEPDEFSYCPHCGAYMMDGGET